MFKLQVYAKDVQKGNTRSSTNHHLAINDHCSIRSFQYQGAIERNKLPLQIYVIRSLQSEAILDHIEDYIVKNGDTFWIYTFYQWCWSYLMFYHIAYGFIINGFLSLCFVWFCVNFVILFVCGRGVLRELVEMHSRGVMVWRLCAYLADRGVFKVNEWYEFGHLVSVILGNCILTFSNNRDFAIFMFERK